MHTNVKNRICQNKRPGRSIFRINKKHGKTHQNPSVLCIFQRGDPLKNRLSEPIGFMYSPLWKITHQKPSVLCTPPFEKWLFLVGVYFGVGVHFGKYGRTLWTHMGKLWLLILFTVLTLFCVSFYSDLEQKVAEKTQQFMDEKNRSTQLLSQLLPQ